MRNLGIIIASWNEGKKNLERTIRTILADDAPVRVLVVDDFSDEPEVVPEDDRVQLIRNQEHMGVALSRHYGVKHFGSNANWLMFTDAHMDFPRGWYDSLQPHLNFLNECCLLSSTYISDYDWGKSQVIQGGEFTWYANSVKDGKPTMMMCEIEPNQGYRSIAPQDVQVVIGAGYFIHRNWYKRIGGLSALRGYGMDEQWLSWNSWLCGGFVRVLGDVPLIHRFQHGRTRILDGVNELRNRLILLQQILDDEEYNRFVSYCGLDGPEVLMSLGRDLWPYRKDLKANYVRNHESVCEMFDAQTYEQAIKRMMTVTYGRIGQ